MVLINNSSRPETGCSFDLGPDLEDERGEDLSLSSFCNRATICIRYLTSENEVEGLQIFVEELPVTKGAYGIFSRCSIGLHMEGARSSAKT